MKHSDELGRKLNADGKKLWKGYFNYYKKNDPKDPNLKSYQFRDFTKKEFEELRAKFSNEKIYKYMGCVKKREMA
jgi:hypothetical protein